MIDDNYIVFPDKILAVEGTEEANIAFPRGHTKRQPIIVFDLRHLDCERNIKGIQ